MEKPDDANLLKRCIEGGEDAWREFVRRYAPYLSRVLRKFVLGRPAQVRRQATVEDLLQDCFLLFWKEDRKALRAFDGHSSLASYLRMIAIRNALNRMTEIDRFLRSTSPEEFPPAPPGFPAPPVELLRREREEEVQSVLSDLPSRDRLLIRFLWEEGLSYREAASLLGVSPDYVGSLVSRALERLRRRFDQKRG